MSDEKKDSNLIFEKYYPQNPLPKEIRDLNRADTVCQFCGISYLIHSEIKRLEEEILQLHKGIKDYENTKISEKHYEQKFNELVQKHQNLITDNLSLKEKIETVQLEREKYFQNCQEYSDEILKIKSSLGLLESEKNKYLNENQNLQIAFYEISRQLFKNKENLGQYRHDINNYISSHFKQTQLDFIAIGNILASIRDIHSVNQNSAALTISNLNNSINLLTAKNDQYSKSTSEIDIKIKNLEEKNRKLLVENNEKDHTITNKEEKLQQKLVLINQLEMELKEVKASNSNTNAHFESLFKEKNAEILKLNTDLQKAINSHQHCESETDKYKIVIGKMERENKEMNKILNNKSIDMESKLAELKHDEQKQNQLIENLKLMESNLQIEIQRQKEVNNQLLQEKVEDKENWSREREKYFAQLSKLKPKVMEMEAEKESLNLKVQYYIEEIRNLKSKLKETEEKIKSDEIVTYKELEMSKNKIIDELEQELLTKEKIMDKMESDLISRNKEIKTLKLMIQKECEERAELSEALNKAREQLLSMGAYNNTISKNIQLSNLPPIDNETHKPTRTSASTTSSKQSKSQIGRQQFNHSDQPMNYNNSRKGSLDRLSNGSRSTIVSTKRKLEQLFNK